MPSPKRARGAPLRTRQAVFVTWLRTSPHVSSYAEDAEKGLSRSTRTNTLANRTNLRPSADPSQTATRLEAKQRKADAAREPRSSSTVASSMSDADARAYGRSVSFARHARVYKDGAGAAPEKEAVREKPRKTATETSRKKAAMYPNPYMPVTAGGQWLLGKSSSAHVPAH